MLLILISIFDICLFSDQQFKEDPERNLRLQPGGKKKTFFIHSYVGMFMRYSVPVQILGQHINDFTLPDVNLIGEHSDAAELGRMLQLILGCAVNCEQKQGMLPILCYICLTADIEFTLRLLICFSLSFSRIHPDHHDDGGVGSACCHDSHPRGEVSVHFKWIY